MDTLQARRLAWPPTPYVAMLKRNLEGKCARCGAMQWTPHPVTGYDVYLTTCTEREPDPGLAFCEDCYMLKHRRWA